MKRSLANRLGCGHARALRSRLQRTRSHSILRIIHAPGVMSPPTNPPHTRGDMVNLARSSALRLSRVLMTIAPVGVVIAGLPAASESRRADGPSLSLRGVPRQSGRSLIGSQGRPEPGPYRPGATRWMVRRTPGSTSMTRSSRRPGVRWCLTADSEIVRLCRSTSRASMATGMGRDRLHTNRFKGNQEVAV